MYNYNNDDIENTIRQIELYDEEFIAGLTSPTGCAEPEFSVAELNRALNSAVQHRADILTSSARFVITLSLTALTLLIPLCAAVRIGTSTRPFLIAAVVFLCSSVPSSAATLAIALKIEDAKVSVLTRAIERLKAGEDVGSRLMVKGKKPQIVCVAIGAASFLLGVLSLCGALFQILLS